MKNMVFTSTVDNVANYLIQRENLFIPKFKTNELIRRIEKDDDKIFFDSVIKTITTKNPIAYRINAFLRENKVMILIPARKYIVSLDYYGSYQGTICSFVFSFPEAIIKFDFNFFDYENDIISSGKAIDKEIEKTLQVDIRHIFSGSTLNDDKKWFLKAIKDFPIIEFEQTHAI